MFLLENNSILVKQTRRFYGSKRIKISDNFAEVHFLKMNEKTIHAEIKFWSRIG
jgi:hypothetical protein